MKTILLISNHVFHYRQKVYNYFFDAFRKDGYEFHVLSNSYQKVFFDNNFIQHEKPFSILGYFEEIKKLEPEAIIIFLHLKDKIMLPIIYYCRVHKIPVIYWNHGINLRTPKNGIKNMLFHYIHSQCNALITYTPDMKKYFTKKSQEKLFVAYNTLNLTDIDKDKILDKELVKKKYGISEPKIILYISRMLPYKRPELLVEVFGGAKDIAVVMVGGGMYDKLYREIEKYDNVYYLGEKYGMEVDEIYKMGDIFSTPGHIGLALVQALFWGLPITLLDGQHAPEIYYMKNGETGYIAKGLEEYTLLTYKLLEDDQLLSAMSKRCLEVYDQEVSIDRMYDEFKQALKYCLE